MAWPRIPRPSWSNLAILSSAAFLAAACTDARHQAVEGEAQEGTTYRVYFLGGQSNMEGFGFVSELPASRTGTLQSAMIFNGRMASDNEVGGGIGIWAPLSPGFGLGFSTDGHTNILSDRFGPELGFGQRLVERRPGQAVALIKYARGGSSLAAGASGFGTWDPDFGGADGINQYDHALTSLRDGLAVRDIDGDGRADRLEPAGIIWMQGEADAYHSAESAAAYADNLTRMMSLLRAAFRSDDLPVVIGRITDSGMAPGGAVMPYISEVQAAQQAFVETDSCAALVTVTDSFSYLDDGWHYQTDGYVRLGDAFADAVLALEESCG